MLTDNVKTASLEEEIENRRPFAMQIDVHGVPTQYPQQIPDGYNYHPLDLWESIRKPLVKNLDGKRVLDVGCNAGFFSFEMAKRGAQVLGVDVNQIERVFNKNCLPLQQAEWIESKLQTGAKFKEMDFMDCDETTPYDKITFLGVYYHLEDPSAGLAKLNRLLKMGGEIYVESETHPTETKYYAKDEVYRLDASNFLIPTPEYLNADMKKNGFTIVETFKTKNVCCGSRYAFRAIKTSDKPNPENTFTKSSTPQSDPFQVSGTQPDLNQENTVAESSSLQSEPFPETITEQDSKQEKERITKEIQNLGRFFQRIDVKGVSTTNTHHPHPLWHTIKVDLKDVADKKILDVGCNAGFFSFELAKKGADVLGIDINQAKELKQKDGYFADSGQSVPYKTQKDFESAGDFTDYPNWITQADWVESELKTGAKFKELNFLNCEEYHHYDTILFLGVYYHLREPSKGLNHLNKLLKVGGELFLESEINHNTSKYYEGQDIYEMDSSVYLVPTPEYIVKDLEHNGFKIVETYTVDKVNRDGEEFDYATVLPEGVKFSKNYYFYRRYTVRAVKVKDVPLY